MTRPTFTAAERDFLLLALPTWGVCHVAKHMRTHRRRLRAVRDSLGVAHHEPDEIERPTPSEIATAAAEVRATWSRGIERARRGLSARGMALPLIPGAAVLAAHFDCVQTGLGEFAKPLQRRRV